MARERRPGAVSLTDVAQRAGVSPKTVSNVVHGVPRMSADTRDRVAAAIRDLGYRPNLAARNLRRGRTGLIALAVPELHVPYFAELATLVIDAAQERGYTVLIDQTEQDRDRELALVAGTVARMVDGIILSPIALRPADLKKRSDTTPIVLLGERIAPGTADHVAIDNSAAARAATEHLIGLGHRRIAAIGAQPTTPMTAGGLRLTGYRAALRAAGIPVRRELIVPAPTFFREDGAVAMRTLLDRDVHPDAVFCFSDLLAIGALRILQDRGLRAPEDLALVGFDDIEDGRYSIPRLTTVAPDKPALAAGAVELVLRRIEGDERPPQNVIVPATLRIRESCGGLSA
ncbi:MAG TPA: LacI family DNA-binding transcriptional regulator [Mycobacteriales bacterium]|nr:LacI family DNA-binding transcriptional regulator [Mycobacteriales bacterium]